MAWRMVGGRSVVSFTIQDRDDIFILLLFSVDANLSDSV